MRRQVFEEPLADALALADATVLGAVNRASLLSDTERLAPERVIERLRSAGRKAESYENADAIADCLGEQTRPGDVVLVMSNGSFDGLCGKLLQRLGATRSSTVRSR
jgi:UDP-N-acetylmuramate: L-alanyl-gamma-D-glutamyl-meso-diaminopimelate ligase